MSKQKYMVYANDLKHKHLRRIDPDKAEWYTEDVESMHGSTNCDSIAYRLEESKKNNFEFLDLAGLELKEIPSFSNYPDFSKLKKIKFLFLNDNNLTSLDKGLDQFINIEVLDVSKNNIEKLLNLPNTLTELSCHNNKLKTIILHDKLIKMDCSFNNLETLNAHENLVTLICESNKMKEIISYPNLKWLTCKNNPLKKIEKQPVLTYLDCSYTTLSGHISQFPKLRNFMCNGTQVSSIDKNINLRALEIAGSHVRELEYYPELKDLIFKYDDKLTLPVEYKIKDFHKEHTTGYIEFHV